LIKSLPIKWGLVGVTIGVDKGENLLKSSYEILAREFLDILGFKFMNFFAQVD
jgi:hypothetical protein